MFKGLYRQAVLAMIALLSIGAQAAEVEIDQSNPYTLVEQVANKTFARFEQDKQLIADNPDHLKVIVAEELMPYIDYKYASYKVLGQYLRDTSKDQRNRFVEAFKGYLISTYAQAFTEYTDQKVEYGKAQDFSGEKFTNVYVQVVEQGRPPIKLQFKARRLKDGSWKAFDLVAEGVSLLSSKQSEITNLVRQQGIESVIEMLNERTEKHIDVQAIKK
ncbi:MlaC/ttg2D family ABC transporter substrate-binding protein [Shewanella fidelis]|uniref:ABC transporter substrate-binding protein n=1 Tax=Shewanella fidelis TaxID=173509 RepID=A0AAW8NGR0_9GAMM|nr:ABC transporter substrate-binding protein [Shewanella fidelis]MDR8522313.1 ABC transporter substrate-binding protein [Shewanella fidelis]MDW4812471.1 ABC transporter substrate-binding protein [Shewanella fidelis]MDW4816218.1 ABC transporter substrate-binding protein [Shewanella fidelis]MDW4820712.1 ABC transporter substrate-binding protein [Shewanella fidelis]MDW4824934.1 ABC transporter substrate-binding protein [Shewanella fidelis]